jgi:two-component system KDP operon response regulator KdpE
MATTPARNLPKILVVDDDPRILAFVSSHLKSEGYSVEVAGNGEEALEKAALVQPSVIVLDLTMPVMDGLTSLGRLREWFKGPVIILSARHEEQEKVRALDLGADDYLTKPFGMPELLARVRAAVRRSEQPAGTISDEPVIETGNVKIDLSRHTVTVGERGIALTPTEYELLKHLAQNAGKVVSHRELLQRVWGPEYGEETEYLRTFVKQLRRKLESDPSRPQYIMTQPGVGYRFVISGE